MTYKSETVGFGNKGANDRPMTFSESLLTGQALPRDTEDFTPKLKPRPKAKFGTKGTIQGSQIFEISIQDRRQGWKFWR